MLGLRCLLDTAWSSGEVNVGVTNIQATLGAKGAGEGNQKSLAREKGMKLDLVESACGRVARAGRHPGKRGSECKPRK